MRQKGITTNHLTWYFLPRRPAIEHQHRLLCIAPATSWTAPQARGHAHIADNGPEHAGSHINNLPTGGQCGSRRCSGEIIFFLFADVCWSRANASNLCVNIYSKITYSVHSIWVSMFSERATMAGWLAVWIFRTNSLYTLCISLFVVRRCQLFSRLNIERAARSLSS